MWRYFLFGKVLLDFQPILCNQVVTFDIDNHLADASRGDCVPVCVLKFVCLHKFQSCLSIAIQILILTTNHKNNTLIN